MGTPQVNLLTLLGRLYADLEGHKLIIEQLQAELVRLKATAPPQENV